MTIPGRFMYEYKICHHPECVQENKNQPLLLCRMCDTQIHSKPGYSGHLVLDSPRKKKPFSPVAPHPPDIITSNYSNSDDDESDVEGDVTEEGDVVDGIFIQNKDRPQRSPSEIQKKLLKRKKVLKKRLKKPLLISFITYEMFFRIIFL
ncbi:hypothetical protein LOTGIDRAFT_169845 [Lottia gigantea]|uniref:Uncharacterized protein n=1 Tax=Lottia gigantea TaxID=225164 RepID=V4B2E7_LOTGI|nr:hypothetical protein LOTGIDRAFT_169845 [Lottia gigantea]ESO82524.1 hypothetical protein LOTGIDRAFT_169845 [Lottia gigantea]